MSTNSNENFAGKVAFVTGAGSGIGRATALAFAREGVGVTVVGQSEGSIQETARLIEEQGGRALAVMGDVRRTEDVQAALSKTMETFGRLDFACNNAGVEQGGTPRRSRGRRVGSHPGHQPARRLSVHEIRNPAHPSAGRRYR